MPMVLKIISDHERHDVDSSATYQIMSDVVSVNFVRDPSGCWARVLFKGDDVDEVFQVTGNAYLMNEQGKTISSFGSMEYSAPKGESPKPNNLS